MVITPLSNVSWSAWLELHPTLGWVVVVGTVLASCCGLLRRVWNVGRWAAAARDQTTLIDRTVRATRAAHNVWVDRDDNRTLVSAARPPRIAPTRLLQPKRCRGHWLNHIECYLSSDALDIMVKNHSGFPAVRIEILVDKPFFDSKRQDFSNTPIRIERMAPGEEIEVRLDPESLWLFCAAAYLEGCEYKTYELSIHYDDAMSDEGYTAEITLRIPPRNSRSLRKRSESIKRVGHERSAWFESLNEWVNDQRNAQSA